MTLLRALLISILLLSCTTIACGAEISVFAASSLSESLRAIVDDYQRQHPTIDITLNFAGSQTLATQIEQGAPADLFISADWRVMARLQGEGLVENPQALLHNRLVLAVRNDLKPPLTTLADLARPGLLLAIGNRQVPIGSYTQKLFTNLAADPAYGLTLLSKIEQNIVSEEGRVKAIVAKLLLDEVDAGIIYQSDLSAANADQLTAISLPEAHNPRALYPLAKVAGANKHSADFSAFLRNDTAQQIFVQHGFIRGQGK